MIVLFSDFSCCGPYTGQMHARLAMQAPGVPVIDLLADAPAGNVQAAAYLLAALAGEFPAETVFLCVVDPGVGSERRPMAVRADGRWYVGPENGLFELVIRRSGDAARLWTITWQPPRLSATFHGRDLFAPVAAMLACGDAPPGDELRNHTRDQEMWPDDLPNVIYVDGYGNAMTGIRAASLTAGGQTLHAGGHRLFRQRTFSDVPVGAAFWYENASGLVEIAVNRGRADQLLNIAVGTPVAIGES